MPYDERLRAQPRNAAKNHPATRELLSTKEVATATGFSTSFLEKGRIYGYGPAFLKVRGKVLYRKSAIDHWLEAHEHTPKGGANV